MLHDELERRKTRYRVGDKVKEAHGGAVLAIKDKLNSRLAHAAQSSVHVLVARACAVVHVA